MSLPVAPPPVPAGNDAGGPAAPQIPPAAPLTPAPAAAGNNPPPPPPIPVSGMSKWAWLAFPLLLAVSFTVALLVLWCYPTSASITFKDAAAAATFTTGAAIVIERLIETGWVLVSTTELGSYWPMSGIAAYAGAMVNGLSAAFKPFVDEADNVLKMANGAVTDATKAAASIKTDVANFETEIQNLQKQGRPGTQQSLLLSAATSQRVQYLQAKYKSVIATVTNAAEVAGTTVNGLQNFVATFKDNPGRRIISLCLGGIMGIATTSVLGLDLFQALANDPHLTPPAGSHLDFFRALHIVFTGLVIGLGAGPTHELIRLIQEAKESRKGTNAAQPSQS